MRVTGEAFVFCVRIVDLGLARLLVFSSHPESSGLVSKPMFTLCKCAAVQLQSVSVQLRCENKA